jgi:hypothetical protein
MGLLISGSIKDKIDAKFPECQKIWEPEATFELKMNLIDLVLRMHQGLSHPLNLS